MRWPFLSVVVLIASLAAGEASADAVTDNRAGDNAYQRSDFNEAARLYRKEADQGDAEAQYNLGVMYANGKGVPQDYVRAHLWSNLAAAASLNDSWTVKDRDDAQVNREKIAAKMTPAQIAEAQKLARDWKPKPERPASP